jgi:hypothetical protein
MTDTRPLTEFEDALVSEATQAKMRAEKAERALGEMAARVDKAERERDEALATAEEWKLRALTAEASEVELGRQRDEALAQVKALEAVSDCAWTPNEDGYYETLCGNAYTIIEGTPEDNSMKFCAYCGGRLVVRLAEIEEPHTP